LRHRFIPVDINYDRTLEDPSPLRALDPGVQKRNAGFVVRTTADVILRGIVLMVLSRWRCYGYACVNFGMPVSARGYCREQAVCFNTLLRDERFPQIERFCRHIMTKITQVVPIQPVSLVPRVFLAAGDPDILEIERRLNRLPNEPAACGAPVCEVHRGTRVRVIFEALPMMLLRRMLTEANGVSRAVAEEKALLNDDANAIHHRWEPPTGAIIRGKTGGPAPNDGPLDRWLPKSSLEPKP
jgi:glycerol-3-phosphate O-acyltransferase